MYSLCTGKTVEIKERIYVSLFMNFKQMNLQNVWERKEHMQDFKVHFLNLRKNKGGKLYSLKSYLSYSLQAFKNNINTYATEMLIWI